MAARIAVLERSNEELSEFSAAVAHDLLEPLTTVIGFLQLAERRHAHECPPAAMELLRQAVGGAQSMRVLVTQLLECTQAGAPLERRAVDVATLVRRTASSLLTGDQLDASIVCGDLPIVLGDPVQLGRLFQNLLSNALKFHRRGVPAVVRVQATDDGRFAVSDNGIGVPPSERERVFGMLTRLHTRSAYPGTGIGLALCRRVVEAHGGEIWIEETPGGGTTVAFTLPIAGSA